MRKKKGMGSMKVKAKITMFSIVMVVFLLISAAIGLWVSYMVDSERSQRYQTYGKGAFYITQAFGDFCQAKVHLRNAIYIYADDPAKQDAAIENIRSYATAADEYLNMFGDQLELYSDEIKAGYEEVKTAFADYVETTDTILGMLERGQIEQAAAELQSAGGVPTADKAEQATKAMISQLEDDAAVSNATIKRNVTALQLILLGLTVVAVIIMIIYASVLIKNITVQMKKLSEAARRIAQGEIDVDCEKIYDDDLGEVLDDFAEMTEMIRGQVAQANEIARGNLNFDVPVRHDKDALAIAVHKMVEDQNATLSSIKEAGSQITVGSEQVANASQALAQGSTEQASALEQVTASMNEVTQRTKDNATKAGQANTLVNEVKDAAAAGNEQMKTMVQAMNGINQSSEMISKIIKTIDDIAFQTNILALNAAVEAARAGVHGKGFAVVAEEVRNLAAKSAAAASETAEMIEDSISKVHTGTRIAEDTEKSLDAIVSSIDEVVALISDITVSSDDQATAIFQIDQAISQVSSVVQTNAATSEQCAAASEELSNQAVTLKNLMANYTLKAGIGAYKEQGGYDDNYNEQIISLDGDDSKY